MRKKVLFGLLFLPFLLSAQPDSTGFLFSWRPTDNYLSKNYIPVDTSLSGFQQYNPLYNRSFGYAFLGNTSSPAVSQIFFDRYNENEFYFLNYYHPYLETVDKTRYYNTRRQFTNLTYINGGPNSAKEEILEVFHTQNVMPNFNFGLKFFTIGAEGQYLNQRIGRNSFKVFSSYEGRKLKTYFNLNNNNFTTNENGGVIVIDSIMNDPETDPDEIPVRFADSDSRGEGSDVKNTFRNFSFELVNDINLLEIFRKTIPDSLRTDTLPKRSKLGLLYITGFESDKRILSDIAPDSGISYHFYDNLYFNNEKTFDSISYKNFHNSLRSYFNPFENISAYAGLTYNWHWYNFHSRDEGMEKYPVDDNSYIPFTYNNQLTDLIFNSGLYFSVFHFDWDVTANYYLSGYKRGDFNLKGILTFSPPSGKFKVSPGINISLESPSYLYQTYFSNSFIWNNSFKQAKKVHLSFNFTHSPKKFETQFDFALLRDIVYFDTNAYPRQYTGDIQVLSGIVKKEFRFWKIGSINKIALQYVNKASIIDLPFIVFNNSTFFQQRIYFKFTRGELLTQLGFDMVYNTKYFAPAYMPYTASFYNQNQEKLGNYPYVDIFLNVKLKRARFFFKFEHVSSGLLGRDYFTVLNYPRFERMFKLGISWNFYD